MSVTDWVAEKLGKRRDLKIVGRTPEDFLIVRSKSNYAFFVAALSVQNTIGLVDVEPLFVGTNKPQLIINVPSDILWSGAAIDRIHSESASFGRLRDVARVADTGDASSYRDRNMSFFINMLSQHPNVSGVSYITEWHLFGSIDRDEWEAADIDLMIFCTDDDQADTLRRAIDPDVHFPPIHLALLTFDEAAEINAIHAQHSSVVFP